MQGPKPQMMSSHGAHNGERGFTIVEVLVAAMLLIVGLLGAVSLIDGAIATTSRTKQREAGTNLAREVLQQARSIPYVHLTPQELQSRLRSNPGLEYFSSSQSGWQIRRRGFTYTVTASVCSIDDAKDGTGPHDAGTFCSDSAGSSSSNPVLDFSGGSSAGGTPRAGGRRGSVGGGPARHHK